MAQMEIYMNLIAVFVAGSQDTVSPSVYLLFGLVSVPIMAAVSVT